MGLIRLAAGVFKATGVGVYKAIGAGVLAWNYFKAPEAKRNLDEKIDNLENAKNNHAESGEALLTAHEEHERTGRELEEAQQEVDEAIEVYEQALKTDKLRLGILGAIFNFIGNIFILIIKLIWIIIW